MAKHIIATCDACSVDGEHEQSATAYRVTLDGKQTEIDLCDTHELALLAPLRALLTEYGQPVVDEQKSSDGRVDCPECGKRLKTRDTLAKHMKRMHDKTINELDDGQQTTLVDVSEQDKPYDCPECGQAFATPQGRGAHRSRAHGYTAGDDDKPKSKRKSA